MREMLLNHSPPIFKPVRTFIFEKINAKVTMSSFLFLKFEVAAYTGGQQLCSFDSDKYSDNTTCIACGIKLISSSVFCIFIVN